MASTNPPPYEPLEIEEFDFILRVLQLAKRYFPPTKPGLFILEFILALILLCLGILFSDLPVPILYILAYPIIAAAFLWERRYDLAMLGLLTLTGIAVVLQNTPLNFSLIITGIILAGVLWGILRLVRIWKQEWQFKEANLQKREGYYREVIEGLSEGVFILDRESRVQICNTRAEKIFGLTKDRILGVKVIDLPISLLNQDGSLLQNTQRPSFLAIQKGERSTGEVIGLKKRDGKIVWLIETAFPLKSEGNRGSEGAVLVFTDITEQARYEERLRLLSSHDRLTGLHNRVFFEEEIEHLEKIGRRPVSFIVADIDDLKTVNDTQGHGAGDELIQRAATILKASFRADDHIARIGGDEFAVVLPGADKKIATTRLAHVQSQIVTHNKAHGGGALSLSLGAATAVEGMTLEETVKLADQRMYDDKISHKRNWAALTQKLVTKSPKAPRKRKQNNPR